MFAANGSTIAAAFRLGGRQAKRRSSPGGESMGLRRAA